MVKKTGSSPHASSSMRKNMLREIRDSLGRYMAILAIVALGVAFFVGLKGIRGDMVETGTQFWEETEFYDLRFLSTVGFDSSDVDTLSKTEGVRIAEGSNYTDLLVTEEDGTETVIRAHTLLRRQNQVVVTAGRKPREADECIADAGYYGEDAIGTTIVVSENNDEDTLDMLSCQEYTIVGLCESSYYVNYERGTTSLGNGKISAFIYLTADGFDTDYYTEIFVRLEDSYEIYSEEYEDAIDEALDWAEPLAEELAYARYTSLKEDGEWQIEEAERLLAQRVEEAEEELSDALEELNDAEEEIADAKEEIADGWEEIADAKEEIAENEGTLYDTLSELEDGLSEIEDGLEQIEEKKIEAGDIEDEDERETMESGIAIGEAQVLGKRAQVEAGLAQANMGQAQLEAAKNEIARSEEALLEAEEELAEAEEELADGWQEYEDGVKELNDSISEAEEEIADAREELADLEEPDSYVLTRDTNVGYACFDNDSAIIDGIADVFPLFFFLVAALVCMTTMARMVEEQRTQIGVLKALGYSNSTIMGKYLFYSGSAALLGGILGTLFGATVFPWVVWAAYGIMYNMGDTVLLINWKLSGIAVAAALVCSVGSTLFTCRYELISVAATLMRPKAPKSGKRIILERIPFIWKHLSFLMKVTARNIFRYRQRLVMMVLGVGGCTALLVVGFGIKDSIGNVVEAQYGTIQLYDASVLFSKTYEETDTEEFEEAVAQVAEADGLVLEESVDITYGEETRSATMVIPENREDMSTFLDLHTSDGEDIAYPGTGEAVLTEKLGNRLGVSVGDVLELEDEDGNVLTVTVSGLSENYVYNYIYLSKGTWEEQLGTQLPYKTVYLCLDEELDVHAASAVLADCRGVASVTVNVDMKERFDNMIGALDYVILLIIFCAGALAFIVLYNLTNINITERLREIATIKVLGFTRGETAVYVFRENLLLTALGALVGLPAGKWLHHFIIERVDIDSVAFMMTVEPKSYLYSFLLTLGFALIVVLVMNRKLDAINMAESMKSIE